MLWVLNGYFSLEMAKKKPQWKYFADGQQCSGPANLSPNPGDSLGLCNLSHPIMPSVLKSLWTRIAVTAALSLHWSQYLFQWFAIILAHASPNKLQKGSLPHS